MYSAQSERGCRGSRTRGMLLVCHLTSRVATRGQTWRWLMYITMSAFFIFQTLPLSQIPQLWKWCHPPPTALQTGPLTLTFLCQSPNQCFRLLGSLQGRFCPPNSQFIFSPAGGLSFKVCQILCPNESFLVPLIHSGGLCDPADRKLSFASSSNILKALCSLGSVSLNPNSPQRCVSGLSLGVPHSSSFLAHPLPSCFASPLYFPQPSLLVFLSSLTHWKQGFCAF